MFESFFLKSLETVSVVCLEAVTGFVHIQENVCQKPKSK